MCSDGLRRQQAWECIKGAHQVGSNEHRRDGAAAAAGSPGVTLWGQPRGRKKSRTTAKGLLLSLLGSLSTC